MRVLIRRTNSEVQVLAPSILFLFSCETPVIVIVILTLSVRKTETRKEVMKMNEEQEEEYTERTMFSQAQVRDILHPHTHLMDDMVFLMHGTQPTEMKHTFSDDDISNALVYMHNEEKSLMTATVEYISNRLDFALEYKQDEEVMALINPSFEMPPLREYLDTNGKCLWKDVSDEDIQPEPISAQAMEDLMADAVSWDDVSHLFFGIEMEEEE